MLARKLVVKVQMTTIDSFCLAFAPSIVAEPYSLMSFYCDLRYKACVCVCTHTHAHRHKSYLRTEEGKRRYFDPGLTIHLFFAPNEGFLFQLWLVLVSVWSTGQAGTDAYTALPQIMPFTAKNCTLVVLTLRSPI